MTLATLILDSLYSGLFLIALGAVVDLLQSKQRRRAARLRASDPFAGWGRYVPAAPHLARAERSTWGR